MSNDDIPFFMVERKIDVCDATAVSVMSSIDAIRVEFGSIVSLITNNNSFAVDSGHSSFERREIPKRYRV